MFSIIEPHTVDCYLLSWNVFEDFYGRLLYLLSWNIFEISVIELMIVCAVVPSRCVHSVHSSFIIQVYFNTQLYDKKKKKKIYDLPYFSISSLIPFSSQTVMFPIDLDKSTHFTSIAD